jgi:hypothetical protein
MATAVGPFHKSKPTLLFAFLLLSFNCESLCAADTANGGIDKDWDFHADIPDRSVLLLIFEL